MSLETETLWEYELIEDVTLGIDRSRRPEVIDKGSMVNIKNMFFKEQKLLVDTGFVPFLGVVRGRPRAQFQFFKKNGSSENILITNDTIYTDTNDQWQYLSNGTDTTLSSTASATDTSIQVNSISGFSDGDHIGIELDTGGEHQTTVNGAPSGSTINLTDAMPSAAASGNAVVEAVELSGSDDDQISIAVMPAFDKMFFTNGQDTVKEYDGSSVGDVQNMPSGGNTKCKALAVFNNHLVMIHTIEGGSAFPQRVRWSDTADPTEWSAGNAGFVDLFDSEDFNITAVPLGPYLMIYKERTIIRMEFVGAEDKLFNFDDVVSGEGAISVDSVIDIGTEHIFIGNSNVYRYKGGFDIEAVGDKVWPVLFGKDKDVNPNNTDKVVCLYIEELDEAWIFYPDAASTFPNKLARLNLINDAWTFREFNIEITGHGFFQTNNSLKWNELVSDWLAQTFKWGGASTQANSPTTILLSSTGSNQAFEYDYISGTDNGTVISFEFETKDFYHPRHKLRTNWLDFRASGTSVTIEYSLDGGDSWNNWAVVSLSSDPKNYRKYRQVTSDRVRFRFKGDGPGFVFNWYGFEFMPESVH